MDAEPPNSMQRSVKVRHLEPRDLDEVIRIDARHHGEPNRPYWESILNRFMQLTEPKPISLGVDGENGLAGYLFGEVRAVEFGSEACGWIFAIGIDAPYLRSHVATSLLDRARDQFKKAGVTKVRTMVERSDVPVLSFFRANRFVGGPFVQLELDLGEETL